jgi:hypothetical protein
MNPPHPTARALRGGAARPGAEKRLAASLFIVGLAINLVVCVPFVADPFDWLGSAPMVRASGTEPMDLIVVLANPDDVTRRTRFFAEHAGLRVVHHGRQLGTLLVRVTESPDTALVLLREQAFASLVMKGGSATCE